MLKLFQLIFRLWVPRILRLLSFKGISVKVFSFFMKHQLLLSRRKSSKFRFSLVHMHSCASFDYVTIAFSLFHASKTNKTSWVLNDVRNFCYFDIKLFDSHIKQFTFIWYFISRLAVNRITTRKRKLRYQHIESLFEV